MTSSDIKIDTEEVKAEVSESPAEAATFETMAKAGVVFGRKRTRTNPKMKKYIFANRNGFELFDLTQTLSLLEQAKQFIKELIKNDQLILFCGTDPAAAELVKAIAEKYGLPYVATRWLGGTLTNFKTISDRLHYYMNMKADQASGKLAKYTKKEQVAFDKEIARLTRLFGGLERLTRLPAALFVVGANDNETAIREAKRVKIPVIAIANTDANPDEIDYLIPANDNSRSSITWILAEVEKAIEEGIQLRSAPKAETPSQQTLNPKS